jgi:endonuclease/exonuclease/phosphatase family metal-dependent hydrolase
MMMVILTSNEHEDDGRDRKHRGPLRRMQQDLGDLARTTMRLSEELQSVKNQLDLLRSQSHTQSQTAKEYWAKEYYTNNTVAQNISATDLRDLNIKINSDVLPGGK